jgi:uncharacterized hydrophobic protein (TIGR00271 family)
VYDRVTLLVGASADIALLESIEGYIATQYRLNTKTVLFTNFQSPDEKALYLLYLSDAEMRELFSDKKSTVMTMGIIPSDRCPHAMRSYGIVRDAFKAIDDALGDSEASPVDLLRCNGAPVLASIVIGDVLGMNRERGSTKGIVKKTAAFFFALKRLSFQSYTLTTAKGSITGTAATGIMVFEHNVSGLSRNLLRDNLSLHDGKLHALVLAPSSILSYLYYLFFSHLLSRLFLERLPKSVGLIASSALTISSPRPISAVADGEALSGKEISLAVEKDALRIHLGRDIVDVPAKNGGEEEKETIRVQTLPKGEMVPMLVSEPIPFLPRAAEEDFKELFSGLRQSAKISSVFAILTALSALLATTGLFQNSAPVIIGAMVLAPMMAPIVSFSMGVVRGDKELLKGGSATLVIGVATALLFSCLYTYFIPLSMMTDEMRSRLNPTLLDLMVAIFSGIAGAYAHAKAEIAKSLAGVAIAVALVPPLSVTGIGIGWWEWGIVHNAFLLFLTNLAGITLAAALTFLVLGFSPVKRATRGILLTMLFLVIVTVPLLVAFNKLVEQNKIFRQLRGVEQIVTEGRTITVRPLSVDLSRDIPVIYVETRSGSALSKEELRKIKAEIVKAVQRPAVLNILSEIELQ